EVAAQVTAIMLRRVGDATALAKVLEDARFNAIGLGPALGLDEEAAALVATALEAGRATVLDADALTLLTQDAALFAKLHQNCVLTPHAGEFKRLFPDIAAKLEAAPLKGPAYSKVDATREAAKRAGCVVLFKGPDTVIAAPDGRCSINSAQYERAAPWLATAGSGDVLTGFIAGLLARGFDPMQAAETAAWLHVECALEFGPGLIAEDLPEQLPNVLKRLLSRP
ncbi:ADP-dependent NAD(P)H-hydrate dehydratase, partial [Thalassovita aquimarina]|uniref:ADP-dependent NAD(P)H-hydrate dehydratase n=1 Tax=Thalassovita aquimarina TaxID=2785917 RepID=UPI003564ED38